MAQSYLNEETGSIIHFNVDIQLQKLLIYENNSMTVEIDKGGIRKLAKYENEIINNPFIITVIEEDKKVTISVDGQVFAQIDNYTRTIL